MKIATTGTRQGIWTYDHLDRVPHLAIKGYRCDMQRPRALLYCMRGRIKGKNSVLRGENVPILAVVTNLEQEEALEDTSRLGDIRDAYKTKPKDITCCLCPRQARRTQSQVLVVTGKV